jgi:hypothetical protein
MKKIILIFIILLSSLGAVNACTCWGVTTPYSSLKSADIVFIGKAISVEEIIDESKNNTNSWWIFHFLLNWNKNLTTFKLKHSLKWNNSKTLKIQTDWFSSCSKSFNLSEEYIVYATSYNNVLSTWFCSRTRDIKYAQEDIEAFKGLINNNISYNLFIISIYKYYIIWMLMFTLFWLWILFYLKNRNQIKKEYN